MIMDNPYIFSFVIAYRHDRSRVLNLKRVVELASSFSGVDVIVVEQGTEPKLPPYSLRGFRYFFIESHLPFNLGWAYNVGFKNSMGRAVIFSTPDNLYDPGDMITMLNMLNDHEVVTFSESVKLGVNELYMPFQSWKEMTRRDGIPFCSGPVAYRSESIQRIGGWSEDFFGDGEECVTAQNNKLKFMKHGTVRGVTYMMPHSQPEVPVHHTERNKIFIDKLGEMNEKELERYWSNSSFRMGKMNKFADV
jgi:glycosyltransferase involved in cell wall biosynthesis